MVAIFQNVPPLDWQTPIVDPVTGKPTPQFILLWQRLFQNGEFVNDEVEDLDLTKVNTSRQIISGGGLTGGGDLSADRTLAVGAGTGIAVNADDVALDASIDDLNDVDTSTTPPTDGQALVWVDADSEWQPGDVANGGVAFGGALVKKAADQTGANYTAGVAIAWDTEVYDTGGFHDNATNNSRLTIPADVNRVRLTGGVHLNNVTNGDYIFIYILKNGAFFAGASQQITDPGSTSPRASVSSAVVDVTASDYFELYLAVQSDTSVDIESDSSYFGIEVVETSATGGGGLTLISSQTPSGTGTVTFSSIPGGYTDLELRISGRTTDASIQNILMTVNGLGGTNYDFQRVYTVGGGTSGDSGNATSSWTLWAVPASGYTTGFVAAGKVDIINYSGTTLHKTMLFQGRQPSHASSGAGYVISGVGAVRTTSAITSITLTLGAGNWVSGSKVSLYGRT